MWTGSYHFARPDATANDAVNEADHFVSTARFGVGDLIPALDLEDAGGLGVTALQAWVRAWLDRVTARIGIRPMIYVSPAFWTKYLGGSRAIADAGYKTLWIAHWGVTTPDRPGQQLGRQRLEVLAVLERGLRVRHQRPGRSRPVQRRRPGRAGLLGLQDQREGRQPGQAGPDGRRRDRRDRADELPRRDHARRCRPAGRRHRARSSTARRPRRRPRSTSRPTPGPRRPGPTR